MAKIKKFVISNWLLVIILVLASFLRLYKIEQVPVLLFGDELDVGYHAYSILKTGKDYSGNPWPLHFQSLAEWRTPLYLYSTVPTVAIWGISPLGVRLPAAIFGILGVWGMYLLVKELLKDEFTRTKERVSGERLALIAALVMTLSPWHIQYSRAAFEVTQLLAFLLFGLYFFFRSFRKGKWLWVSAALLVTTPLIYSTAKLFTPALFIFLFLNWKKEILKVSKSHLRKIAIVLMVLGGIVTCATLFSGGGQRFGYISIFTDPTVKSEVGVARLHDARFRGELGAGLKPSSIDKFFHNKLNYWLDNIVSNYLYAFSTDFLFIRGDPNLRHSIKGVGQFYWIEAVALVIGVILFFTKYGDKRVKRLIIFWLLFGVVPSAITREGGNHATRLILILPPLVFLISYGLIESLGLVKPKWRKLIVLFYFGFWILSFGFYEHNYWVHNPWYSERLWHAGFREAIYSIKDLEDRYDRIFISMEGEPAWIFFAGWYEYPPEKWQKSFPFEKSYIEGFGKVSYIDKFYFGSPSIDEGIYGLEEFINEKDLYLAVAKEVEDNLIREPEKTPSGLSLIKAIPYPSGEPAYYLFSGN